MLYQEDRKKQDPKPLFQNPTAAYRGAPFWAWNTQLREEELLWQIEQLKAMGFGGFHMHPRAGFATEYLSPEFMKLVRSCTDKAKSEKMLAWLYDEDRWPSGFAGGFVTKNPKYRQKHLLFTVTPQEDATDPATGYETGRPYLLSCFDICLGADGTLASYRAVNENEEVQGTRWYVYVGTPACAGRYNGYTYVDTLSEEAVAEFIRVTYEAYLESVGDEFGKAIPAIFTDEPQFTRKQVLPFAESKSDILLPYTTDFAETFREAYGIDLIPHLPELLWDLPNGEPSRVRYLYHDHACERFTKAFSDQCGKWCGEHNIALTGHMMEEDSLEQQTHSIGEAMRGYRGFQLPGIDLLCNYTNLSTAKQCQSAVHQYGREGMLSELYGVTGWDFDFRGHKYQGDWQAALGVTVRVPHLSWVSMKGSAKRDYPASISYQSAWYKEYPTIEDHFARVNTILTRGEPDVKVGVIHPVESYWLYYGPAENTADQRTQLQSNFDSVTKWLLFGTVDFDYISESLLPEQLRVSEDGLLHVGEMAYSAIVIPSPDTIRSSTVEILSDFCDRGGKVIFMGDCPKYVDALPSEEIKALYDRATRVSFTSGALLKELGNERDVSVRDAKGHATDNLLYQMRREGEVKWFFLAHGKESVWNGSRQNLRITFRGTYGVTVYDTMTGETRPAHFVCRNGNTEVREPLHGRDSLLLRLDPPSAGVVSAEEPTARKIKERIALSDAVAYRLDEPNAMILDMCQLSEDGVQFGKREEILRLDRQLREKLGYPMADGRDVQPWCIEQEAISHFPYLRFTFESEVEVPCKLAYEEACEVMLNGESVPVTKDGFFCDHDIFTMPLPTLKKGENELIIRVPFGKRISLEAFYLLGEFGVRAEGSRAVVTALPKTLSYGSVIGQGLPFYGAAITYVHEIELEKESDIAVLAEMYQGALVGVKLDGEDMGKIVFSPYRLTLDGVKAGKHTLELTLFATRINTFGALHYCGESIWYGPTAWYSDGIGWSYEYRLHDVGILKSPEIEILE